MRIESYKKQLEESFRFVVWADSSRLDLLERLFNDSFSIAVKSHKKRPVVGLCCVLAGERQFFAFRSLGSLSIFLMRVPEIVCFFLYHN